MKGEKKTHYWSESESSESESSESESSDSINSFEENSSKAYTSGLKISSDFFVAVDFSINFKILGSLAWVSL